MYDAFPDLPATYDSVPLYYNRREVEFYVEEARDAGGSVLEVGCGTGRILLPIARFGSPLTDESLEQIVCAERVTTIAT